MGESQSMESSVEADATVVTAQLRAWFKTIGIVLIVLGVFAVAVPWAAALAIEIALGSVLLLCGISLGIHAFQSHRLEGSIPRFVCAGLYLLSGIVMLAFPLTGVITLTLVLALLLLLDGAVKLWLALVLPAQSQKTWLIVDAVLGLLLGTLILTGWPGDAGWVLGVLLGIKLVFAGIVGLTLAGSIQVSQTSA